jgi:hypothetical protein
MLSQHESKNTPFAAQLDEFRTHKEDLLAILRRVHENNGKFGPFNEGQAWYGLTRAAISYFLRNDPQRKPMLAGRRQDRLNDLAKAITRARKLTHKATQDDVGIDLFRAWHSEIDTARKLAHKAMQDDQGDLFRGWQSEIHPPDSIDENGSAAITAFVTEIRSLLDNLSRLEVLVLKGSVAVKVKKGAPSGTGTLSWHDVLKVAHIYERGTGQKAILEAGPFAEFACQFLIAVGQESKTLNDNVFETFNDMRKALRKRGDLAMLPKSINHL